MEADEANEREKTSAAAARSPRDGKGKLQSLAMAKRVIGWALVIRDARRSRGLQGTGAAPQRLRVNHQPARPSCADPAAVRLSPALAAGEAAARTGPQRARERTARHNRAPVSRARWHRLQAAL